MTQNTLQLLHVRLCTIAAIDMSFTRKQLRLSLMCSQRMSQIPRCTWLQRLYELCKDCATPCPPNSYSIIRFSWPLEFIFDRDQMSDVRYWFEDWTDHWNNDFSVDTSIFSMRVVNAVGIISTVIPVLCATGKHNKK